jgi:hypothetical protein
MKLFRVIPILILTYLMSCNNMQNTIKHKSASEILGNPNYLAMSYSGYRTNSRRVQPTVSQLKKI